MQTHSEENYLKAIYLLGKGGNNKVTVTALALVLGHNPASVIDMLKKLTEKKLIEYNRLIGAKLMDTTEKTALLIIRKHRLWELFLQSKLGYTWDEVHEIAEQLEHVHHEDLADRLDEFLGYPKFDPHGEAIPDKNGQIQSQQQLKLNECHSGDTIRLISVINTSDEFLKFLNSRELRLGLEIKIKSVEPFDRTMIVSYSKRFSETLSLIVCERLLVEMVPSANHMSP
jgi:DtxR family transcriptional regulator, Mn-dependent transcriptional regulator